MAHPHFKHWMRTSIANKMHGKPFTIGFGVATLVLVAGIIGLATRAAGGITSAEPENGTLSTHASMVNDTSASGGKAVKFMAQTQTKTYSCTTSVLPHGTCGPYPGYAKMTGIDGSAFVDQNVWAGGAGYTQSISANSPGDWKMVANANTNFGGVQSFPNTGWGMPWPERKVDTYTTVTSSWNVTLPRNPETAAWAAYDLWLNNWADEVMIQVDIQANSFYNCDAVATATFSGQPWHMCEFGAERVWKRGTDDNHLVNQDIGSVNVQEILLWMEQNGHLQANSTWTAGSFGFEVCDTGGLNATFTVNDFTWASQ